jgi:PKD repeat protein
VAAIVILGATASVRPMVAAASSPAQFNVVSYGADPTGVKDSAKGIQAAIAAAQSAGAGSIVYVPTGTYSLQLQIAGGNSLEVIGTVPIEIRGDGPTNSIIVEARGKNALDVQVDGTVVDGLTLDTQTNNDRTALVMAANNTQLFNATILGGDNTFALYYPGPTGASRTNIIYDTGNQINNITVNDKWTLDGFSFSYQQNGLIQNVDHTGSRLALFIDRNVEVDNEHYHPGTQTNGTQGFWITPPSDSITINGFVTDGNGGTLGSGGNQFATNITLNNEVFNGTGFHLSVGEVANLTINGCNFGNNNSLRFITAVHAIGLLVENCSALPVVRFTQPPSGFVQGEFDNNTYTTFTPVPLEGSQTFVNGNSGPTDFTVNGGTLLNCAGGLFKGKNTTFAVSNLTNYPCTADSPPAAALTLSHSSTVSLGISADASASTDSDATPIADYQFAWGDGSVSTRQTSAVLSHTYAAPGLYTVTVSVIDTAGLFSTASAQISVTPDSPPAAALTVTPNSGPVPLNVVADASASTDTDVTPIATYTFDFGDGSAAVGPQAGSNAGHEYTSGGSFTVTVTVTDSGGLSSSTSRLVNAAWPNLVGNPDFESGTTGWRAGAGTTLGRSSTAHSGSFSAQLTRTSSNGRALFSDSPVWNTDTTAGTTCTVSAWVFGPAGIKVAARALEFHGTTTVAKNIQQVKLAAGTWKQVTVTAPIVNGGDTLGISFYGPLTVGQSLLVDDVSETCH